jgi:acyl-CoA thioesterase I
MSNALVYHIVSGQAFFSGIALIAFGVLSTLRQANRRLASWGKTAARLGLFLIAVSSTPLSGWFYLIAGTVSIAWFVVERSLRSRLQPAKPWLRISVLAVWLLGGAMEIPYHLTPTLTPLDNPTVYVVGDSVSAGMGGETETWPKILARSHGLEVHDLSLAGANVAEATRLQAGRVAGSNSLVLVEIGGNDVLGETTPEAFALGLDVLLGQLRERGRTVVMLELPLPPFYHRYGAAQRRLARRHGVLLVPKRVLLGVLLSGGATLDTIHLSESGHSLMARRMWEVIRGAFGPPGS